MQLPFGSGLFSIAAAQNQRPNEDDEQRPDEALEPMTGGNLLHLFAKNGIILHFLPHENGVLGRLSDAVPSLPKAFTAIGPQISLIQLQMQRTKQFLTPVYIEINFQHSPEHHPFSVFVPTLTECIRTLTLVLKKKTG